jgi:hypothetical protein
MTFLKILLKKLIIFQSFKKISVYYETRKLIVVFLILQFSFLKIQFNIILKFKHRYSRCFSAFGFDGQGLYPLLIIHMRTACPVHLTFVD